MGHGAPVLQASVDVHASAESHDELPGWQRGGSARSGAASAGKKITDSLLEEITKYYTIMPRLNLTHSGVTHPVLQAFSQYAPNLFKLFTPKECFAIISQEM